MIDTNQLSALISAFRADGRFFEVGLSQTFLEYGLWQDYGTDKETPRGNPGDIGRTKTSCASRTQSQASLNSAEAQPRMVDTAANGVSGSAESITLRS